MKKADVEHFSMSTLRKQVGFKANTLRHHIECWQASSKSMNAWGWSCTNSSTISIREGLPQKYSSTNIYSKVSFKILALPNWRRGLTHAKIFNFHTKMCQFTHFCRQNVASHIYGLLSSNPQGCQGKGEGVKPILAMPGFWKFLDLGNPSLKPIGKLFHNYRFAKLKRWV